MLKDLLNQANGELRVSQGREKKTPSDLVGETYKIEDCETIFVTDNITGEEKELIVVGIKGAYFMAGSNLLDKVRRLEELTGSDIVNINLWYSLT